jgi:hypothetical protein
MATHNPLPELAKATDADFDARITQLLVKRYRIGKQHRLAMLKEAERRFDNRRLSLVLFLDFFPTFPMVLCSQYIYRIKDKITIADLFGDFAKTLLVNSYNEWYRMLMEDEDSKPFGLVFNWPHVAGSLVLHNHAIDTRVDGTRLLWTSQNGQLVVETLGVVLDTLDNEVPGGKGWQAEVR